MLLTNKCHMFQQDTKITYVLYGDRIGEKIAHLNARVRTIIVMKDIVFTDFIIHRRTPLCQITG